VEFAAQHLSPKPVGDVLDAMTRFVVETDPSSFRNLRSVAQVAVTLYEEFTAVERLHLTVAQNSERPSESSKPLFGKLSRAAQQGRFESGLVDVRKDLAKEVVRRMVSLDSAALTLLPDVQRLANSALGNMASLGPAKQKQPTDSWLQSLLRSEGRLVEPGVDSRARRVELQRVTELRLKVNQLIAPAMLKQLEQAIDSAQLRPLHEVFREQDMAMRAAVSAHLKQPTVK
jgi:hypothetical protein